MQLAQRSDTLPGSSLRQASPFDKGLPFLYESMFSMVAHPGHQDASSRMHTELR